MDTVHECDRQTNRITITNTVQRIASHGNEETKQETSPVDGSTARASDAVVVGV